MALGPRKGSKGLAWHWAFETLADQKQVNTSVLRDLMERVSDLRNIASETAGERVFLRYLEECAKFVEGNASNASDAALPSTSSPDRRVSEAPIYVEALCRRLGQGATSDNCRTELFGHDLHQFIHQKRVTLPKSSLILLKESILHGNFENDLTLKELIDFCKQQGCYSNDECQVLKNPNDGGIHSPNQSSVDAAPDSGNIILQDDPSRSQEHLPNQDPFDSGNIILQDDPSVSWQHLPDQNASACSRGKSLENCSTLQQHENIQSPRQSPGTNIISEKGSTPQIPDMSSDVVVPSRRRKTRKRPQRYSNPILPPGRRTKLHWEAEEEEFLKDAMQKFDRNSDGSIPWSKILESGCHVFNKTRTPVDLKDKWRNITNRKADG